MPNSVFKNWNSVPADNSSSSRKDWCSSSRQLLQCTRSVADGQFSKWNSGRIRRAEVEITPIKWPSKSNKRKEKKANPQEPKQLRPQKSLSGSKDGEVAEQHEGIAVSPAIAVVSRVSAGTTDIRIGATGNLTPADLTRAGYPSFSLSIPSCRSSPMKTPAQKNKQLQQQKCKIDSNTASPGVSLVNADPGDDNSCLDCDSAPGVSCINSAPPPPDLSHTDMECVPDLSYVGGPSQPGVSNTGFSPLNFCGVDTRQALVISNVDADPVDGYFYMDAGSPPSDISQTNIECVPNQSHIKMGQMGPEPDLNVVDAEDSMDVCPAYNQNLSRISQVDTKALPGSAQVSIEAIPGCVQVNAEAVQSSAQVTVEAVTNRFQVDPRPALGITNVDADPVDGYFHMVAGSPLSDISQTNIECVSNQCHMQMGPEPDLGLVDAEDSMDVRLAYTEEDLSRVSQVDTDVVPSSAQVNAEAVPSSTQVNAEAVPSSAQVNAKAVPSGSQVDPRPALGIFNVDADSVDGYFHMVSGSPLSDISQTNIECVPNQSHIQMGPEPDLGLVDAEDSMDVRPAYIKDLPRVSQVDTEVVPSSAQVNIEAVPSSTQVNIEVVPSGSQVDPRAALGSSDMEAYPVDGYFYMDAGSSLPEADTQDISRVSQVNTEAVPNSSEVHAEVEQLSSSSHDPINISVPNPDTNTINVKNMKYFTLELTPVRPIKK